MGAVAAIILLFICLIGSRNETVYKVIIALMYLFGIVLFIMGCATGFGYAIGGGMLSILIAYFLTYVVSAGEISIFTLFNYLKGTDNLKDRKNTRKFYPASKKAEAARNKHLEEIKAHSKERAAGNSIPTYDELQKFHGWSIPKTPLELYRKIYNSYGNKWSPVGWDDGGQESVKMLIEDYSSEFYDTTVHYEWEEDWYIILYQVAKQEYKIQRKKKFEDAERVYGFKIPQTPLDFAKEYAYMENDVKLCETYYHPSKVIIENENSPFFPDSSYYKGKKPAYEDKEELIEACVRWYEEKKKKEAVRAAAKKREDDELKRAIASFK